MEQVAPLEFDRIVKRGAEGRERERERLKRGDASGSARQQPPTPNKSP
jgi:hypothetical protein